MKRILLQILLGLICLISIIGIFLVNRNVPIATVLEKTITEKDSTFKGFIHTEIKEPFIYVFYNNNVGIGLAIIEMNHKFKTHIFGSVPKNSPNGFTFGTGESDQLKKYIMYGAITNTQISQVFVNEDLSNLAKVNGFYLWYYISESPFKSTSVIAKDQSGFVVFEREMYL